MISEGVLSLGFFLLMIGAIVLEIFWLVKNNWATTSRAAAYVLITDVIGVGGGAAVVVTLFLVMAMMAFGHSGRGGEAPDAAFIVGLILSVIIPPVLIFFVKRIMLSLLKIKTGAAAWTYSLVITILIALVIIAPPAILYFLDSMKLLR